MTPSIDTSHFPDVEMSQVLGARVDLGFWRGVIAAGPGPVSSAYMTQLACLRNAPSPWKVCAAPPNVPSLPTLGPGGTVAPVARKGGRGPLANYITR